MCGRWHMCYGSVLSIIIIISLGKKPGLGGESCGQRRGEGGDFRETKFYDSSTTTRVFNTKTLTLLKL